MRLITGGSGFIGINLARKLIEKGEKVKILDIVKPDPPFNSGQVEYLCIDIREREKVIEACNGVTYLYHIVSLVPISKAGRKFWDVNVEGTRNVLEGALKYDVKKVIHMSSSAVYGVKQKNPLNEASRIDPLGVYAHSKHDGEKVCQQFRKLGVDITIVRPRTVVGPERLGIYQILYNWVRQGRKIYIIGSGDNKIQFIHVKELADALILMAEKASNETFNLGTERFSTLREDLETLIRHAGTKSKVISLPRGITVGVLRVLDKLHLSPLADWHYYSYHKDFYFDITKAKEKLGWNPKYSNAEMLVESYDWYINNYETVERQIGTTHRKSVRQRLLGMIRDLS